MNRRGFLKGLTATLTLPLAASMIPEEVYAALPEKGKKRYPFIDEWKTHTRPDMFYHQQIHCRYKDWEWSNLVDPMDMQDPKELDRQLQMANDALMKISNHR